MRRLELSFLLCWLVPLSALFRYASGRTRRTAERQFRTTRECLRRTKSNGWIFR